MISPEKKAELDAQIAEANRRWDELIANTKKHFIQMFINRPLEPYASRIADYYCHEVVDRIDAYLINETKDSLVSLVTDNLNIALMAKSVCTGIIKGPGYVITQKEDVASLRDSIESLLISRLDDPFDELRIQNGFDSVTKYTYQWSDSVNKLPTKNDVEFNEAGQITEDSIDKMIASMKQFLKESKSFQKITQEYRITEFLGKLYEMGVPMKNGMYRDLYQCLEFFEIIPKEQLHLHNTSTSKYVKEQYMKQKVNRLYKQLGNEESSVK